MKNTYEFETCFLSITLEPGWVEYAFEDAQKDGPLTFMKEEHAVGALHISFVTSKINTKFDINEQLKRNNYQITGEMQKYKLNDWQVYEFENNNAEWFTKYFYLTKSGIIVFVTYNCELEKIDEKELSQAIIMARTIEVSKK
jgi:hypothetical protein